MVDSVCSFNKVKTTWSDYKREPEKYISMHRVSLRGNSFQMTKAFILSQMANQWHFVWKKGCHKDPTAGGVGQGILSQIDYMPRSNQWQNNIPWHCFTV